MPMYGVLESLTIDSAHAGGRSALASVPESR